MSFPPRPRRATAPLAALGSTPGPRRVGVLVAAALASCAATPAPALRPPELVTRVTHWAGDPIGGPLPDDEATALELSALDAWPVRARLWLLAGMPAGRRDPLIDHVRMIVAEDGTQPLVASSLLTPGTRLLTGDAAGRLAEEVGSLPPDAALLAASFDGVSLPGVTTTMAAIQAEPVRLAGTGPAERRVSVELWREDAAADSISLVMSLSDVVEVVEGLADSEPSLARRPRQEKLVLDVGLEALGRPLGILAPVAFDPRGELTWFLLLERSAPPTEASGRSALQERVAAVRAEVREASAASASRREALDLAARRRLLRLRAVAALEDEASRRAALVELAGGTGARMAAELAVVAEDDVLARLVARLAEGGTDLAALAGDDAALGWALERESVAMFLSALEQDDLEPQYQALLLRHAGEAVRFPGALEDALAGASGLDAFYGSILEENRIALEESSPSARVRAYDWLASRGVEVPGYDPLAGSRERRAALRAWAEAEAGAAGAGEPEATEP